MRQVNNETGVMRQMCWLMSGDGVRSVPAWWQGSEHLQAGKQT